MPSNGICATSIGEENIADSDEMSDRGAASEDDRSSESAFETDFCETLVDLRDTYNMGQNGSSVSVERVDSDTDTDINSYSAQEVEQNTNLDSDETHTKENCSDKCHSDDDVICLDSDDDQNTVPSPRQTEETSHSHRSDECNFKCSPEIRNKKTVKSLRRGPYNKSFSALDSEPHNPERKLQNYFRNHIETVNGEEKTLSCRRCNFKTTWRHDLQIHIEMVHVKEKRFRCALCTFRTHYKNSLATHVATIHTSGKSAIIRCDKCSYFTRFKSLLERHQTMYHGNADPAFSITCQSCGKCFRTTGRFKNHSRNCPGKSQESPTTEQTKLNCTICNFITHDTSTLQCHVSEKHADTLQMVTCKFCSYKTYHRSSLDRHLTDEHGGTCAANLDGQPQNNSQGFDVERDSSVVRSSEDHLVAGNNQVNLGNNREGFVGRDSLNDERSEDHLDVANDRNNFNVGRNIDAVNHSENVNLGNYREYFDVERSSLEDESNQNRLDVGNEYCNFDYGNTEKQYEYYQCSLCRQVLEVRSLRSHAYECVIRQKEPVQTITSSENIPCDLSVRNNPEFRHNHEAFDDGNNAENVSAEEKRQQCVIGSYKCRFCDFECTIQQVLQHILTSHVNECVVGHEQLKMILSGNILDNLAVGNNQENYNVGSNADNIVTEERKEQHAIGSCATEQHVDGHLATEQADGDAVTNKVQLEVTSPNDSFDAGKIRELCESKKVLVCEFCGFQTRLKYYLDIHKGRKHSQGIYTCEFCLFKCVTWEELKFHVRSKHARKMLHWRGSQWLRKERVPWC